MEYAPTLIIRRYAEQKGDEELLALIDECELLEEAADELRTKPSTMGDYQTGVERTVGYGSDGLILGLAGEVGEVIEIWKKHRYHNKAIVELDRLKMIGELGDVLWYLTAFAASLGIDLATISRNNIEKLKQRYPDGFDR